MGNKPHVNEELHNIIKKHWLSRKRAATTLNVTIKTLERWLEKNTDLIVPEDKLKILREKYRY